jgi:hypothetical protein
MRSARSWTAAPRSSRRLAIRALSSHRVITARCSPFPMRYLRAICGSSLLVLVAGPLLGQGALVVNTTVNAEPVINELRDSTPEPLSAWVGLRREFLSSSPPIRVILGATFDQWQDVPKAWHPTLRGFGQRGGVRFAEVGTQLAVLYGTAALLGQDPTYRPRRTGSRWARTQHALIGSVTAYRTDGSRAFSPGTFTGAVAAAVVAKQLLPASSTRGEIVSRGTSMLTNRIVRSLLKEFSSPPRH